MCKNWQGISIIVPMGPPSSSPVEMTTLHLLTDSLTRSLVNSSRFIMDRCQILQNCGRKEKSVRIEHWLKEKKREKDRASKVTSSQQRLEEKKRKNKPTFFLYLIVFPTANTPFLIALVLK